MALATGSQIGKYVLGRRLGQGGFGIVFAARDSSLDRDVALKFLKTEYTTDQVVVKRFLQEARAAAKIVHPGIVTVYECGQVAGTSSAADGAAFIAMELLEGEGLTERLGRTQRFATEAVLELGRQCASALEAAHRAGIVHRDLKPDNIFLIQDPMVAGGERVKILDFGIAKLARSPSPSVQTESLMIFGTPRYMSPEQCKSSAHVDHRSDIYTLGCILFELASGQPPFLGVTGELIAQHLLIAPKSLLTLVPDAPPGLATLIDQMLAKEPDARPPTMAAVQRSLALMPGVSTEAPSVHAVSIAPAIAPAASSSGPAIAPAVGPAIGAPVGLIAAPIGPIAASVGRAAELQAIPEVTLPYQSSLGPPMAAAVGTNETTTLSSMAGSRLQRAARIAEPGSKLVVYAAAAVILIAIPIGIYVGVRGDPAPREHAVEGDIVKMQPVVEPAPPARAEPPQSDPPAAPRLVATTEPRATKPSPPRPPLAIKAAKPARPVTRPSEPARPAGPAAPMPGKLAITAKPGCDIYVDGKQLAANASERELELAPGRHRVTLLNSEHALKDSFVVEIKPGVVERVAKDFTSQLDKPRKPDPPPRKPEVRDATINPFDTKGGGK